MPDLWLRRTASKDVRGTLWVRDRGGDRWVAGTRAVSKPQAAPAIDRFLASKPFYVAHRLGGTEYPEFTQKGPYRVIEGRLQGLGTVGASLLDW